MNLLEILWNGTGWVEHLEIGAERGLETRSVRDLWDAPLVDHVQYQRQLDTAVLL